MKKQLIFAFLIIVISSSTAFSQISACYNWSVSGIGYSEVLHDDVVLRVSGIAGTEFIVFDYTPAYCNHDFDSWVYSELANSSGVLSNGRLQSNRWQVEGRHGTYNAQFRKYCVTSAHGMVDYWSYDDGKIFQNFTDEYTLAYSRDCYTFTACPLNPSIACPTPTPTPTPTPPGVAITQRTDIIEKNGTKEIKVTVTNNSSGTTKLNLRATNGTGDAVFDTNNSTELIINGNVTDQAVKIKGTAESSGVDNITVEAKLNTNTAVVDHDEFTVAVISSLVFERIDATYAELDSNPGNGIAGTAVGQRIYPDQLNAAETIPTITIDRSLVKITATVSPAIPNLNVYFASFDLDDPSSDVAPIDTLGSLGNDNNGGVSGSNSGDFRNPTGGSCTNAVTGVTPDFISKINCTTSSTTASTNLKVTMQPGDNFAVVASLTEVYRDGIVLNSTDGSKLMDAANNELPITRTAGNNVQGIRTNMLTVWRNLHIEVDTMAAPTGLCNTAGTNCNKIEGNLTETKKVPNAAATLKLSVTNLELNRFENGRLIIKRAGSATAFKTLRVRAVSYVSNTDDTVVDNANTADSVTVINNTGVFSISPTDSFVLYDDDDMNDDGVLDGDEGDVVLEPDRGLLQAVDTPCTSVAITANNCNVFASAYVVPAYDLTGNQRNVPFSETISSSGVDTLVQTYFQNKATEANQSFWTIYLLGAYQTSDYSLHRDPNRSNALYGETGTIESTVFIELARPTEYDVMNQRYPLVPVWTLRSIGNKFTTAHEVGHLFGCNHTDGMPLATDYGVMGIASSRTTATFNNYSLNIIRKRSNP